MIVTETTLKDCYLIEPTVLGDDRGYFFESFNNEKFYNQTGIQVQIVQENQSLSKKGVLRGMHFQIGEAAQSKIVRVLNGEVLDVVIDIRRSSPTFGQHHKEILSEANKKQIYVPRGFAHGFLILSEQAEFFYCIDRPYSPANESGIIYNDPHFNIDWGVDQKVILSERDKNWPLFAEKHNYFE